MIRVIVVYEEDVDPERYERHIDEFCRPDRASTFRHGKVLRIAPRMEPALRHYAEFEFPDMDAFKARRGLAPSSRATGKDAAEMGVPFTVHLAEVD